MFLISPRRSIADQGGEPGIAGVGGPARRVAAAFAVACALWWVYFVFAAGAIRYALRTAEVAMEVIRPVLPYGHLAFIGGIIAIAAATGEVILHPLHHLHTDTAALLFGGTALYLATFGYTRCACHTVSTPRLSAAAVCLALLPLAGLVPALAAMALTAVLVASTPGRPESCKRPAALSPHRHSVDRSPADQGHVLLVVAVALHADRAASLVEVGDLVGRQRHRGGAGVLLDPLRAAGAGDGHDPRVLGEQPGQGDLPGRGVLARRRAA